LLALRHALQERCAPLSPRIHAPGNCRFCPAPSRAGSEQRRL